MDHSEQIVGQLRAIKWFAGIIAVSFAVIAVMFVWLAVEISGALPDTEIDTAFAETVSDLLDQGKAKEVLALSATREKSHPMDPYVFWCRAKACHQLGQDEDALKAMQRVHEIAPDWRDSLTTPFIQEIKAALAAKK